MKPEISGVDLVQVQPPRSTSMILSKPVPVKTASGVVIAQPRKSLQNTQVAFSTKYGFNSTVGATSSV